MTVEITLNDGSRWLMRSESEAPWEPANRRAESIRRRQIQRMLPRAMVRGPGRFTRFLLREERTLRSRLACHVVTTALVTAACCAWFGASLVVFNLCNSVLVYGAYEILLRRARRRTGAKP